ncbi:MAG: M48 family metalloprotease [Candidatus Lokiarchaeota archaeon]|nr:M48 family metalloprotease [Candidatus Lokiarchaeota archaeon]
MVKTLLLQIPWLQLLIDWSFILTFLLYFLTIEEFYQWAKNGKRSEMSDIVAILFFFFVIFFFSKDFLTSLMGAFSIYLWIGIFELRDYPVLNKVLIISLVTYNVIFIAGIFSFYLDDPFFINTSFAFSFWIILIMGFILFGRKYLVVWRFLSPEYLMLFIYIIAWLAVVFVNQYTPFNLITTNPFNSNEFKILDFFLNIYFILILVNWLVYFTSGPILDKLLGIKTAKDEKLIEIVKKVKEQLGISGRVKVGFGKYPILNAMAYGSVFDKRIAIIANEINEIPEDELKGIVAHELAHTKGKHTLILTLITTSDLIVRMFLGIPATYYDYTFGDPSIPLFVFIILNLSIYFFLFIFVRILEGKADLRTKKIGYANELAKALYNLESFYASGREIGFNTMLLCDEKISKDNLLLDYMNTASYLYNSMIKPSKTSLLGSFLNSHPPSYFRIAAILGDELKPSKEAILPFICLKKSKQKKYGKLFEKSRQNFNSIANAKFKEYFQIENISDLLEKLQRKETYKYVLNKDYIFVNKITDEIIFGHLENVIFLDNISSSDQLAIRNLNTQENEHIEASKYTWTQIDLNETYFLQNDKPLILKSIDINNESKENRYTFLDKNNLQIQKPILKTKLPNSIKIVKNLNNDDIFLKNKGKLKVFKCVNILKAENLEDYKIILYNPESDKNQLDNEYSMKDLIIRPQRIYLTISRDPRFRRSEVKVFEWLQEHQILIYIYLKNPVNNMEIGYIQNIEINYKKIDKKSENSKKNNSNFLYLKNIFGSEIKVPYDKLESISFRYSSAMIQIKSATSLSSRLGYKLLKKFKPERIIIT